MTHFDHFDFLAPIYDRLIKPSDPARLRLLASLPVDGNLLDVGGGTGRMTYLLKDWVKEVVIVDSSIGMLTQAKKKSSFITVWSNAEQLPFRDESFERVIMVDALHHVFDYRSTIDELWRVVKPLGRIVIEEPDIRRIPVKIMALGEKLALMRSHFVSPLVVKDAFHFSNAGVRIERDGATSWIVVDKRIG